MASCCHDLKLGARRIVAAPARFSMRTSCAFSRGDSLGTGGGPCSLLINWMMESFQTTHESCEPAGCPEASAACPGVTGSTAQSTRLTLSIATVLDSIALKMSGRLPSNSPS